MGESGFPGSYHPDSPEGKACFYSPRGTSLKNRRDGKNKDYRQEKSGETIGCFEEGPHSRSGGRPGMKGAISTRYAPWILMREYDGEGPMEPILLVTISSRRVRSSASNFSWVDLPELDGLQPDERPLVRRGRPCVFHGRVRFPASFPGAITFCSRRRDRYPHNLSRLRNSDRNTPLPV